MSLVIDLIGIFKTVIISCFMAFHPSVASLLPII